jgi:hypothetical protein
LLVPICWNFHAQMSRPTVSCTLTAFYALGYDFYIVLRRPSSKFRPAKYVEELGRSVEGHNQGSKRPKEKIIVVALTYSPYRLHGMPFEELGTFSCSHRLDNQCTSSASSQLNFERVSVQFSSRIFCERMAKEDNRLWKRRKRCYVIVASSLYSRTRNW